ncbi:MAG TPA: hypothetical protein VHE53_05530 [Patescibacteria group bacterium]|nr:hypothetical protein [Patescibacteria group bacterium]
MEEGEKPQQYPPLTAEKAKAIIFGTFPLSQGEKAAQRKMFSYIKNIRPDWVMTDEIIGGVEADFDFEFKTARVVLSANHPEENKKGEPLGPASVGADLSEAIDYFDQEMLNDEPMNSKMLIRDLVSDFIRRDHYFLVEKGGRRRAPLKPGEELTAQNDPYHSNFVYYVMENHSTRVDELDEMLSDMRKNYKSLLANPDDQLMKDANDQLGQVLEVYRAHHPEEPIAVG